MTRVTKKSVGKSPLFLQLDQEARAIGERRDCAVKAVAVACGVPYDLAWDALNRGGREKGRGTSTVNILAAIEELGFHGEALHPRRFISKYPGKHKNKKFITTHHPDRFKSVWEDGETYLFFTRGHVLCVKNGENHDWTRGTSHRVQILYRVRPVTYNEIPA